MAENEDPADAAARLEQALERISVLAQRSPAAPPSVETARIAARLDALIAQLRAALGAAPGH